MTMLLIRHGASLVDHFLHDVYHCLDWDIDSYTNVLSAYSEISRQDLSGRIPAFLPMVYKTAGRIDCRGASMSPIHLVSILKTDIDLNEDLGWERSLMHLAIADQASATFVLNSDLRLENATPFPWHLIFWSGLPFLESMCRHFRRKLKDEDFLRIAHLQPARGWSPLCLATADQNMEMIHHCLCLGAELDFEGTPHGSALVLACACGYLEAVRSLVRAGASLSYQGQHEHKSVFTFCRSESVRRWLLVERFIEQRRITTGPHWENSERARPRAGTVMARLKLVGDRAMRYHETRIEYAKRLAKMRKDWRGKVIPTICIDEIVYRSRTQTQGIVI